jgi:hypothetical protein
MENMLAGTEAPSQMQVAFDTIRNLPLIALKPAPLTRRISAKLTTLNMTKATDMKQNSFRIGKGVFMCTTYGDALAAAGDLLSATAAHERILPATVNWPGASFRRALSPAT